jgi:hypothetical protein
MIALDKKFVFTNNNQTVNIALKLILKIVLHTIDIDINDSTIHFLRKRPLRFFRAVEKSILNPHGQISLARSVHENPTREAAKMQYISCVFTLC